MNKKAFIFDLDGVIVDTAKYHFLAWQKIAAELGIEFTPEHNEHLKGVSRVRSLDLILELGKIEASQADKDRWLIQKNEDYLSYLVNMNYSEILPGVMPVLQYLKEQNPNIQVWAIDVFGSLLTNYYQTGNIDMGFVHPYISEGFGEDFVPENYDMSVIDHFEQVTDKDGAVMARRIAKEEGIFIGYSAGSCLQGLIQLKDRLKKDDLVVCIFHDHGSRYVAKIYNDQWMMERGFLDVKTFKDIVSARAGKKLITVSPESTVAETVELMKKYDIEQIPVMSDDKPVGAVSEGGLFQKLFSNGDIKTASVSAVMEAAYPVVAFDTPVEKLGNLITKENGAVLAKDESGSYQIVTKYDIIQSLAK